MKLAGPSIISWLFVYVFSQSKWLKNHLSPQGPNIEIIWTAYLNKFLCFSSYNNKKLATFISDLLYINSAKYGFIWLTIFRDDENLNGLTTYKVDNTLQTTYKDIYGLSCGLQQKANVYTYSQALNLLWSITICE